MKEVIKEGFFSSSIWNKFRSTAGQYDDTLELFDGVSSLS